MYCNFYFHLVRPRLASHATNQEQRTKLEIEVTEHDQICAIESHQKLTSLETDRGVICFK